MDSYNNLALCKSGGGLAFLQMQLVNNKHVGHGCTMEDRKVEIGWAEHRAITVRQWFKVHEARVPDGIV